MANREENPSFKRLVITVSGFHGSGRTTHAKKLAKTLGLKYISSGIIFRQMAEERGISLEEMSRIAEDNKEFDKLIDKKTKEESKKGGVIVDATLSAWMAEDSDLRIFLIAPFDVRVRRIAKRESISLDEAKKETISREKSERDRFLTYYGVDINDLSIYDLVLNTNLFGPEGTARILKKFVDEYCLGR